MEKQFNELMQRNYNSILKRGLITKETTMYDFVYKMQEELSELNYEVYKFKYNTAGIFDGLEEIPKDFSKNKIGFELADVILTALNMAKHFNINILNFLNKKIDINEKR